MTDAYHIGAQWEQAAKDYYEDDCVDIEFNTGTGLYCTNVNGIVSKWKHENDIKAATTFMLAAIQERELTANIPSEDI